MAKTKAQPDAFEPATDDDNIGLSVAKAILWASERLHVARMTQKEAGNPLNYNYWKHGKKNPTELLVQLVPKALSIIDKNRTPAADADVVAAEKQSIKDLEELLEGAIEDANLDAKPEPRAVPDELSEVGF